MRAASAKFRLASWLAIAAMALQALWPLLANAQPSGQLAQFEVCSSDGVRFVNGDTGQEPAGSVAKHLQPHCALCSFGADKAPAVAPLGYAVPPAVESSGIPSATALSPPASPDPRSPAQSRAPPLFS